MATRSPRSRLEPLARWSLAAAGALLLPVLVAFAGPYLESPRVLAGTLLLPLASVVALTGIGLYIATHRLPLGAMRTVITWTLLGLLVMAVVVAWYGLLDRLHDHAVPFGVAAIATLAVGASMGALVGWYNVRVRETVREAAAAREREAALERQRETLALVDRTLRHHLVNALSVVEGHAVLLEDHVEGEAREHVDTIRTQAADVHDTIDDIRAVTDAVTEDDAVVDVDLDDAVRDAVASTASAHPDAEFAVEPAATGVTVRANRMLPTLLVNLLNNAVQHNDADTPRVRVTVTDHGDEARVSVHDNGPGIPSSRRDAVFRMGASGEDSDGSGMGLFLVRTVVERLGGRVTIEDAEDGAGGATVVVSLPTADDA